MIDRSKLEARLYIGQMPYEEIAVAYCARDGWTVKYNGNRIAAHVSSMEDGLRLGIEYFHMSEEHANAA